MIFDKAYRVQAKTKLGDDVLIVTSDRDRALKFLGLFADNPLYVSAWIELGTMQFSPATKEKLP